MHFNPKILPKKFSFKSFSLKRDLFPGEFLSVFGEPSLTSFVYTFLKSIHFFINFPLLPHFCPKNDAIPIISLYLSIDIINKTNNLTYTINCKSDSVAKTLYTYSRK